MALGMEVGLGPGHIVPAPLHKKAAEPPPQFSAHFYCRQTIGCIKMPLGMEVGLSAGDFVLDGEPATPRTEGTPTTSQFLAHVYYGQTAGWMHDDAPWYGSRPRRRPHCIRPVSYTHLTLPTILRV